MPEPFKATGGAQVGWVNATLPFASLTASSDWLLLKVGSLGDYLFAPADVIAINRYGARYSIFGKGIIIHHCKSSYPEKVIFWYMGNTVGLLQDIQTAGFVPQAPASSRIIRPGLPFRWQAAVSLFVIWNLLITAAIMSMNHPSIAGTLMTLAVAFLFAAAVGTLTIPRFQTFVIKPGRDIGEVRPILYLAILISGALTLKLAARGIFGW